VVGFATLANFLDVKFGNNVRNLLRAWHSVRRDHLDRRRKGTNGVRLKVFVVDMGEPGQSMPAVNELWPRHRRVRWRLELALQECRQVGSYVVVIIKLIALAHRIDAAVIDRDVLKFEERMVIPGHHNITTIAP